MLEATTLAYLAGMIDGDGYISITRSTAKGKDYFAAQVGIAGTRREPHDLAASLFGGAVYCYRPANPRHRPQFQWQRMGKAAVPVIEAVLPYLLIKADHALLALELQEHVAECTAEDPFPWFSPSYDPITAMRRMREEGRRPPARWRHARRLPGEVNLRDNPAAYEVLGVLLAKVVELTVRGMEAKAAAPAPGRRGRVF